MKRVIIVLTLLLCCKLLFAQSPMYTIEIYADRNPIMDFSKINPADIKWKMINLSAGADCFVTESDGKDWYFNPYGLDGVSLPTFTMNLGILYAKKTLFGGETMSFEVEITDGVFAGYKGKLTFTQSVVLVNVLRGKLGINLTKEPAITISIPDVTLCDDVAGTATATVTGVEGGYTVTWSGGIMTSGDGTTGSIPASLPGGIYTATVTAGGASISKEFQLTREITPDKPQITMERERNPDAGQLSFKVCNEPAEYVGYSWFVNNRLVQTGGKRFEGQNLRDGDVVVCKTLDGGECYSGVESDKLVVDHRLLFQQAGEKYFVPNLVTPNGDGLNDTWRLDWLQSCPKYRVTIFSSQGKIVYQTDSYQNNWNGRVDGTIRYGVYVYKIELPGNVVLQSWLEVKPTNY